MKNKASNKILSLFLTVVMIFSMLPLTATAESEAAETETGIITAFDALSEDAAAQSVEAGTPPEDLNLPDTLSATIDGAAGTVAGVTWQSEPAYDADTAGTYIFTAVIPGEYTVEEVAELPVITVTVSAGAIENDELTIENDDDSGPDPVGISPLSSDLGTYTFDIGEGNITIDAGSTSGLKVTYGSSQNTEDNIPNTQQITITGTTTDYTVTVQGGVTANITLNNVRIDVNTIDRTCAFEITGDSTVNLTLSGDNILKSGYRKAGLQVKDDNTLTITAGSTGSLTATGGDSGAGIGSGSETDGGTITISGGTVTATSVSGAGIGGGYRGTGSTISITGGTVTATSVNGAGIGSGYDQAGGTINISGGTVTATASGKGAGIGGGGSDSSTGGAGGTITISGGTVKATGGTGRDIGPGYGSSSYGTGGSIKITGGSVKPTRGNITPPTSDGSTPVYLNTLTVGIDPVTDTAITAAGVDGGAVTYGINDVVTDGSGNVYFWLPQSSNAIASVSVTADNTQYSAAWSRTGTTETQTLTNKSLADGNIIITQYDSYYTVEIGGSMFGTYAYSTPFTITGSHTANTVTVTTGDGYDGTAVEITLAGVSIDVSTISNACAFEITNGANVNLTLSGDNILKSGYQKAGLQVPADNTLTITGTDADSLTANGGNSGAGIGGNQGSGGTITISGGTVNANGGDQGAGIGGGNSGAGGEITISGGMVTATGGNSAGIGGGNYGAGGTINISGGTVKATGTGSGAGIGGGLRCSGGTINISGGTVKATGGDYGGAGIGGGCDGDGGTINISSGTVTATGSGGRDIGPGESSSGSGDTITITGGSIYPTNGSVSPQPTDGTDPVYLNTLTVGDPAVGDDVEISSMDVDGASSGYGLNDVVTMNGGKVYFWLPANDTTDASVLVEVDSGSYSKAYTRNANNENAETLELVTGVSIEDGNIVITQYDSYYEVHVGSRKAGRYGYSTPFTITGSHTANTVTVTTDSGYTSASDPAVEITLAGVSIDVSTTNYACAFEITNGANVNLTLSGDNTLKSGYQKAGLQVEDGNTLTITGTDADSLTANGGDRGASIGGGSGYEGYGGDGGNITISGGTVNANGGNSGAGIGGGNYGAGGTITINSGTVNANGGDRGASIGGGNYGAGGTITITGGTVTANGGNYGAGIGGGNDGAGGEITISGGTVNATGGMGASIGGGNQGSGGTITISGGTVTANSVDGAGIGGGYGRAGGTINISGGTVEATSYGAGIGGGGSGAGGTINISGGTVTATGGYGADIGNGYGADIGYGGACSIEITGGSVYPTRGDVTQPTSDGTNPVYLNTLIVGNPAVSDKVEISSIDVDGVSSGYGLNDVVTMNGGKVYFWLPANDTTDASVLVEADSDIYAAAWARTETSETITLLQSPYTVTFNSNDGTPVDSQTVAFAGKVTTPAATTREGYTFNGWYTDDETFNNAWDFESDTVTAPMTLYAKWTDTTPPTGEIKIENNSFKSFLNTITFGLFFKNTVDVTITGQDDGSGVASIEYQKVASKSEYDPDGEWISGKKFSVIANETFIVYARITDKAGNVTIISSDGVVVYKDSAATVNGGSFSKASTDDLDVSFAMNGNTVKSITSGGYTLVAGADYTVDYTTDGTIIFKNAYLKNLADGTQSFTVTWYPLGETAAAQTGSDTPGTTAITVSVSKSNQNALSITGLGSSYTYGDSAFDLSPQGGSGSGEVTFTSSDPDVASVSGKTVTIHKAGSFTITAVKEADAEYNKVSVISHTVTVNEAMPAVTLTGDNVTFGQDVTLNVTVSGAGAVPEGTVIFKEGTTALATEILVNGEASYTTTTNPTAGNHTYTAEYSGQTDYYAVATGTKGIGVDMTDQATLSITGQPATVTYGDSGFKLDTDGGSGTGTVTFSVPNNNVVSITTVGEVTIRGAGSVTVTAVKTGDNNYNPATATLKITVLQRDIDNITVTVTGSTDYTGSQLQPIFSVSDGTLAIDTGDYTNTYGTNVTVAQGGSITLTGQRNYTGTKTINFTILKAPPQAVVFPTAGAVTYDSGKTLADITLSGGSGDGTFAWQDDTIVPTASNSGYTVVFTPNDTDNYDYSGITLTETVTMTVSKAEQTLTGLPNLVKVNGGDNFTVTPGSNAAAENPNISFQSSNTTVIDFDTNGNFLIKGDGTVTITVIADETANYKAATATFEIRVLANTADLNDVINAAQDLIDGLQTDDIGSSNGQYPQGAVDALQDAIDKAKDVANDTNAIQAEVDAAKEDLLKAIEDFQNSLIAVDFTALDKAIADAGALEKGYYTDTTWDALQTALSAGKTVRSTANVTQAEVDAAAKAINDAISALESEYKFTTEFGTFTGSGDLTGKVDAPYAKFVKLLIGGKEVDSDNYTVTEGSTVITLKEAYLKTLTNATYTVTAEFTDGSATTKLTVNVSSTSSGSTDNSTGSTTSGSNPATGDNSMIRLWISLLGISSLGISGIALTRKRKLIGWKRK